MRQALTALLLFIEAFVGWSVPATAAVPTAQPIMSVALAGSPLAHVSANRRRTGGGGGLTIPYNTQFGVTDPATGWIAFPLHSGNQRYWLKPAASGGSDTNDCLTFATACATWDHVWLVYRSGVIAHGGGDQLMVGGPGTYTDNGVTDDFHNLPSGISMTYPNAVISYDIADPTNAAKYGRQVGPDMPVLIQPSTITWERSLQMSEGSGTNYLAVQGIALDAQGANDIALSFNANSSSQHNGIVFQNTRWQGVRLTMGLGPEGPHDVCQVCGTLGGPFLLSKSSGYGQWSTGGNFSFVDVNLTDGYQEQEVIGGHAGWKVGVNRATATVAEGGPITLGHGRYYAANSRNGKSDFTVWFDNAVDGDNIRGGMIQNYEVSINEPTVGTTGGISNCVCEAPNGVLIQRNTGLVLGGIDGGLNIGPRGSAWGNQNTVSGSHIDNFLLLANPFHADGPPNHKVQIIAPCSNTAMLPQYLTMSRITGFNYSYELQGAGTAADGCGEDAGAGKINITWANSKTDQLAPGTGNSVSSSGDFTSPWTSVSALPTAMGVASLERFYNLMLYRPDLPWARAIITAAFTAHNKSQPLSGVPPPNVSGITPPQVYTEPGAPTLGTLALSSTTYTRGSSTSGSITGATASSTLSTTGIPSGLTINSGARTWAWDGSGSGGASGTWTLTETLAGATNTPHANTIGYTINAAGGGTNLLLAGEPPTLFSATWNSGTRTVTVSSGGNFSVWTNVLSGVSTGATLHLIFDYTMSSGAQLRVRDGAANTLWTSGALSSSGHIDVTFTKGSGAGSDSFAIEADSATFTGTIIAPTLTSP